MKILVAEDSAYFRKTLEDTLIQWGYEVIPATNGLEAWEILQQNDSPRLAILDWVMPKMTGLDVCKMVRKRERGSYVYTILLTSKSSKENVIAGLEAGVDDYIVKPFDEEVLRCRLKIGERILTLEDKIMQLASIDGLTGLLNRRVFMERFENELKRFERERRPLALIIIDLDNFKQINDNYGHLAGDEVLRQVARQLSSNLRKYDIIGRYGGEEFTVCAPGIDMFGARELAERLRKAIESLRFVEPDTGEEFQITASLGISWLPHDGIPNADVMLKSADEALYLAKRRGKNQTCCE